MGVRYASYGFAGRIHTRESRERLRQARLRRCADPVLKEAWSLTPHARRWWYSKVKPRKRKGGNTVSKNTNNDHFGMTKGNIKTTSAPKSPKADQPVALPTSKGRPANQPDK